MAYSNDWDENDPDGAVVSADQIDEEISQVKTDVRERIEQVIPDWTDDNVDPKTVDPTSIESRPRCKVELSAAESIGDAAAEKIQWDTEVYDVGDMVDLGSNDQIISIPETGLYLLELHVLWNGDSNGNRRIAIEEVGTAFVARADAPGVSVSPGTAQGMSVQYVGEISSGTDFQADVYQDSTAALDIEQSLTYFAAMKLNV